jgi:hypothetical protein
LPPFVIFFNASTPRPRPAATSKQQLIALLKQASTACDSAFDSLYDAAAMIRGEKIRSVKSNLRKLYQFNTAQNP